MINAISNFIIRIFGGYTQDEVNDEILPDLNREHQEAFALWSNKTANLEQALKVARSEANRFAEDKLDLVGQLEAARKARNESELALDLMREQFANASEENETLRERLCFDPGGGDKIDELETALDNLRHERDTHLATLREFTDKPRIYKASVTPHPINGKVGRYTLDLLTVNGHRAEGVIEVRGAVATNKNKTELQKVAAAINDKIAGSEPASIATGTL